MTTWEQPAYREKQGTFEQFDGYIIDRHDHERYPYIATRTCGTWKWHLNIRLFPDQMYIWLACILGTCTDRTCPDLDGSGKVSHLRNVPLSCSYSSSNSSHFWSVLVQQLILQPIAEVTVSKQSESSSQPKVQAPDSARQLCLTKGIVLLSPLTVDWRSHA